MLGLAYNVELLGNSVACARRILSKHRPSVAPAILLSLSFSTAAIAQSSTTDCHAVGSSVHCDTRQRSGIDPTIPLQVAPPPQVDWNAYRQMQAQRQAQQSEEHQQQVDASHAQAMAEVKDAVIQRLRDGDCKNAIEIALLSGDIELATQTKNYCAAPAPGK